MPEGASALPVNASQAEASRVKYLKDYQPPAYLIETTDLQFDLRSDKTRVESRLQIVKNPDSTEQHNQLELNGDKLKLLAISIDDKVLDTKCYSQHQHGLIIHDVPLHFELTITTEIDPKNNLTLEGLYLSDGMYCTQCEAEGFRRITFYLDRPDVMSVFTTRIIANQQQYPVLLSNGNRVDSGVLDDGRHWVQWSDPFKKPAYLFALVAGDLQAVEDTFTTASGRDVALQIFVESKDLDKCDHAMQSLKNAMRWDEQVYGREYDLDLYMIVAVDFFNMGAMENKGLNIFNTSCVLANPLTQTDAAFQRVEAVVAHEYFHNWSGNRVTCRDWFQLSLKEGFTVFRDACFSADMNSPTVKRVEDVSLLRSAQFAEDAGPMAHPIRPESYIEISNFYTLTIYEKGAEVIRMMHQLLGAEAFRAGSDLYFERHDGQAVTCEDFIVAMEDASGQDLAQFRNWYSQAGTPRLAVSESWDASTGSYTLNLRQTCPATPGQAHKQPMVIPLRLALLGENGLVPLHCSAIKQQSIASAVNNECVLPVTQPEQSWCFTGLDNKPVPSLLRGFSAPVKLSFDYQLADLLRLIALDNDGFVRWDASQRVAIQLIEAHVSGDRAMADAAQSIKGFAQVLGAQLAAGFDGSGVGQWNHNYDAALVAELLRLPDYQYVLEQFDSVDIAAIQNAKETLAFELATEMGEQLLNTYQCLNQQLQLDGKYSPDANSMALRSLKNTCLAYLLKIDRNDAIELAWQQFEQANNMTDQASALTALVNCRYAAAAEYARQGLARFYQQWSHESLVVNQWLGMQAASENPAALERVNALMTHAAYDNTNPNKVRALIGGFCMRNIPQFHAEDGGGYRLLADEVIRLNALNPQLASRLLAPLTQWQRFQLPQRDLMQQALRRVANTADLSPDVFEVVTKSLADS